MLSSEEFATLMPIIEEKTEKFLEFLNEFKKCDDYRVILLAICGPFGEYIGRTVFNKSHSLEDILNNVCGNIVVNSKNNYFKLKNSN